MKISRNFKVAFETTATHQSIKPIRPCIEPQYLRTVSSFVWLNSPHPRVPTLSFASGTDNPTRHVTDEGMQIPHPPRTALNAAAFGSRYATAFLRPIVTVLRNPHRYLLPECKFQGLEAWAASPRPALFAPFRRGRATPKRPDGSKSRCSFFEDEPA